MRLAWVTDVHLDFLDEQRIEGFFGQIASTGADGVVVSGDTALAGTVGGLLERMGQRVGRPIWFVLGNHDFYGGSIAAVRRGAAALSANGAVVWLGGAGVVDLCPRTALVGHDGWGDARLGNADASPVLLTDFFLIAELADLDQARRAALLRRLGDEAAAHLQRVLPEALESHQQVLVVTHVPPFREACWHRGGYSDDDWLPYFTCRALGEVLVTHARRRPDRSVTVLCGHTHSGGECWPLPNLRVVTGAAEYGRPVVQQPLLEV